MLDEQAKAFLTLLHRRIGSLEIRRSLSDTLFQFLSRPMQCLLSLLTIGNIVTDRQQAGCPSERNQVCRDQELSKVTVPDPHQYVEICDGPLRSKSINQSGSVSRVGPDPQEQGSPADDFLAAKPECLEARIVDFQATPGFKFRNTDGMGTETEGFSEELVSG